MSQLTIQPTAITTMTSLELVVIINEHRAEGAAELRHDNFMAKIEKHPGIDSPKFLGQYKDSTGRTLKCYNLPKRESELMVMSESLVVQTRVYDRMTALEAKQTPAQSDPVLACLAQRLTAASLFKIPEHLAQIEATKEVLKLHGVDFSPLLKIAPAQQNILREEESLEPTDLGKTIGYTGKDFNLLLVASGMQVKTVEGWFPTEEGKPYATVHSWAKGAKSGYNIKWRRSVLKQLDL